MTYYAYLFIYLRLEVLVFVQKPETPFVKPAKGERAERKREKKCNIK